MGGLEPGRPRTYLVCTCAYQKSKCGPLPLCLKPVRRTELTHCCTGPDVLRVNENAGPFQVVRTHACREQRSAACMVRQSHTRKAYWPQAAHKTISKAASAFRGGGCPMTSPKFRQKCWRIGGDRVEQLLSTTCGFQDRSQTRQYGVVEYGYRHPHALSRRHGLLGHRQRCAKPRLSFSCASAHRAGKSR